MDERKRKQEKKKFQNQMLLGVCTPSVYYTVNI